MLIKFIYDIHYVIQCIIMIKVVNNVKYIQVITTKLQEIP